MYIPRFAAIAAGLLFSSCAIHPLPEDVTGLTTAHIVKQIRCETRDAARAIIIRYLTHRATRLGDDVARDLLVKFEADRDSMTDFDPLRSYPGKAHAPVRQVFDVIYSTGVAYTFDLTMTEENNLNAGANLLGPWAEPLSLGLGANANRTRDNNRNFTITDTLGFLLKELNTEFPGGERYCDGNIALGPNYVYPIAGRIGIDETVYTFFQLSFLDGLGAKPGGNGAPSMADKLTFTTMIDVTATPKVVFAKPTAGFQPVDASGGGTLRRKDQHQVTVGLALDPKGKGMAALTSLRGFVFSGAGGRSGTRGATGSLSGGGLVVLNRVTASATTPAEQLAVLAIDQLKSRELQLITSP